MKTIKIMSAEKVLIELTAINNVLFEIKEDGIKKGYMLIKDFKKLNLEGCKLIV